MRYLPHRVSQLFALYLRDVIPFRFMINPNTSENGFLFGDEKPWPTEKFTDVLKEVSSKYLKVEITSRDFRQIIIAIDREHVRPDEIIEDIDDDDAHDMMAAHMPSTSNKWYGQTQDLTHDVTPESRKIFQRISQDLTMVVMGVQRLYAADHRKFTYHFYFPRLYLRGINQPLL